MATTKVEVRCSCGKRYNVPSERAGKHFKCKKCGEDLVVPAQVDEFDLDDEPTEASDAAAIAEAERQAILAELGINADQAAKAYEASKEEEEARQRSARAAKQHCCVACSEPLTEEDLAELKPVDEFRCRACKVEDRSDDHDPRKRRRKGLDHWNRKDFTDDDARSLAMRYGGGGALVAGPLGYAICYTIGLSAAVSVSGAVVVGAIGGYAVYTRAFESIRPRQRDQGGEVTLGEAMSAGRD